MSTYRDFFIFDIFERLESTNQYLFENISFYSKKEGISIVVAEHQSHGRGRLGRRWFSNSIGSLTFSALWNFKFDFKLLSGLSLLISLCLVRVLIKLAPADYKIKWPNDVVFDQRKIAGILIESKSDLNHGLSVIIGIGVNIKLPFHGIAFTEHPATDLYQASSRSLNRNQLLAHFLIELYQLLEVFKIKGFGPFRDEWMRLHCHQNQPVVLHMPNKKIIEGVAVGVTNEGQLILKTDSGLHNFAIGDISLRSKL